MRPLIVCLLKNWITITTENQKKIAQSTRGYYFMFVPVDFSCCFKNNLRQTYKSHPVVAIFFLTLSNNSSKTFNTLSFGDRKFIYRFSYAKVLIYDRTRRIILLFLCHSYNSSWILLIYLQKFESWKLTRFHYPFILLKLSKFSRKQEPPLDTVLMKKFKKICQV